ncbi:MAG: lipoprotein [Acinetobacter sp.]
MMKKVILLAVFTTALTGCVVAPYDDHYPRDGRNHSGQYDHRDREHHWENDRNGRPDWGQQNRQGDNRHSDGRHSNWNNENRQ